MKPSTLTLTRYSGRAKCRMYWITGHYFAKARNARTQRLREMLDGSLRTATDVVYGHIGGVL